MLKNKKQEKKLETVARTYYNKAERFVDNVSKLCSWKVFNFSPKFDENILDEVKHYVLNIKTCIGFVNWVL